MQVNFFSCGGRVAHKIRLSGSDCRFSAWYDAAGNLVACEGIDKRGNVFTPGKLQRLKLANKGPYVMAIPHANP